MNNQTKNIKASVRSIKINKNRSSEGFTIVELLIVIVVIGILAAISIVAYNGIQTRALNSSRTTAARQALTLLNSHKAIHDTYPSPPLSASGAEGYFRAACLGEGWPEVNGQKVCWHIFTDGGSSDNNTFLQSSSVNNALREFGSLPDYPKDPVYVGPAKNTVSLGRSLELTGLILLFAANENPASTYRQGFSLVYTLPVDEPCDLPGSIAHDTTEGYTRCVVHLGN